MKHLIDKNEVIAEIEKRRSRNSKNKLNLAAAFEDNYLLSFLDTLEVKEEDLIDRKTNWSPSNKQIESLGALVRYNIGVFDYQKLNEVALLYDDLTKILDYETNRQK